MLGFWASSGGGVEAWTQLTDTPGSITALEFVRGNAGGTALEFVDLASIATLQYAYDNSTSPEITLDATRGALTIQDNATPIAANLFEVQTSAGADLFEVDAGGVTIGGPDVEFTEATLATLNFTAPGVVFDSSGAGGADTNFSFVFGSDGGLISGGVNFFANDFTAWRGGWFNDGPWIPASVAALHFPNSAFSVVNLISADATTGVLDINAPAGMSITMPVPSAAILSLVTSGVNFNNAVISNFGPILGFLRFGNNFGTPLTGVYMDSGAFNNAFEISTTFAGVDEQVSFHNNPTQVRLSSKGRALLTSEVAHRFDGTITNTAGRIKNTTRVTTTYTILVTDYIIYCNTDSAAYTATLPVGAQGQDLRVINSGSSGNDLTLDPDGSEDLIGVNSSFTLRDGEALAITYDSTDGWY